MTDFGTKYRCRSFRPRPLRCPSVRQFNACSTEKTRAWLLRRRASQRTRSTEAPDDIASWVRCFPKRSARRSSRVRYLVTAIGALSGTPAFSTSAGRSNFNRPEPWFMISFGESAPLTLLLRQRRSGISDSPVQAGAANDAWPLSKPRRTSDVAAQPVARHAPALRRLRPCATANLQRSKRVGFGGPPCLAVGYCMPLSRPSTGGPWHGWLRFSG